MNRSILKGLIATAVLAAAGGAFAQARQLKWAHVYETSEPYHTESVWAAEEIKKRSNGKFDIKVFPASSLGKETDLNQGMTLGTVDMIISGTSFAAPFVAGAAALVIAAATRRLVPLSPFAVRDLLVRTARPYAAGVDSRGCGAGTLDVAAAVAAVRHLHQDFDDEDGDPPVGPPGPVASHLGRGADRPQLI